MLTFNKNLNSVLSMIDKPQLTTLLEIADIWEDFESHTTKDQMLNIMTIELFKSFDSDIADFILDFISKPPCPLAQYSGIADRAGPEGGLLKR